VSIILIAVAAYGRAASQVTNIAIIGGIIGCGVFLFLVSLLGLVGAAKHHQVLLFFVRNLN
jgi:tetraspanin-13/31